MTDFTHRNLTVDSYFDKIFYINLRKDVQRNENLLRQFKKFDINNFERIEAIELRGLPGVESYRNFIKTDTKYISGQLSCRASHQHVVNIARQRKYSRILIIEDDALFLQDPNKLLIQNYEVLSNWDMLYFGGLIESYFRNQIVCTHAYAIKSTLFDDIFFMAESSGMEIDLFYAKVIQHMGFGHNQSGKYNIRIIVPFNQIIQDKSFESNIQTVL